MPPKGRRGGAKIKRRVTQVIRWYQVIASSYFFWRLRLRKVFRGFFVTFLNCPCYKTPKKAIKKSNKTAEGGGGGGGGKKSHILCDELKWIFWEKKRLFCRVFELPLLRNAQKRDKKNQGKKLPFSFYAWFLLFLLRASCWL
jgi:hypothetical protein